MNKPILSLNKNDIKNKYNTLGMTEYLTYLRDSNKFDITYHTDRVKNIKGIRGSILYYQGKKIFLDFWEYSSPTYCHETYDHAFDLIIKLQHKKMDYDKFNKMCHRKKMLKKLTDQQRNEFLDKIIPWSFFPSKMMKKFIGKEHEVEPLSIEQTGFFCGKAWKSRNKIKQKLEKDGIEFVKSSQELKSGRPLTESQYVHKMRTSKYGVVLAGRCCMFTQAKNRREIDYMMMKKPLLINYKPYYYNKLIEGKHYIFVDINTDLDKIEAKYDIEKIAINGFEWYKNNASPNGIVETFLKIMKERLQK